MRKIRVYGQATVTVSVEIEVDDGCVGDDEEIFDKAYQEFGGIHSFAGNGGFDKIIGVSGSKESIEPDDWPEFIRYEEI